MELERTIRGGDRTRRAIYGIVQLENITLDLSENGFVRRRLRLVVLPCWIQFGDAFEKFAAEFAEGSEEQIPVGSPGTELEFAL